MGICRKLTKLKSALKKWPPAFTKLDRTNTSSDINSTAAASAGKLHPVYVGRSRRRYLVGSDVIDHPLFRVLVSKSDGSDGGVAVDCEVVLFEHLLWMLENADSESRLESMDELVEFYSY